MPTRRGILTGRSKKKDGAPREGPEAPRRPRRRRPRAGEPSIAVSCERARLDARVTARGAANDWLVHSVDPGADAIDQSPEVGCDDAGRRRLGGVRASLVSLRPKVGSSRSVGRSGREACARWTPRAGRVLRRRPSPPNPRRRRTRPARGLRPVARNNDDTSREPRRAGGRDRAKAEPVCRC